MKKLFIKLLLIVIGIGIGYVLFDTKNKVLETTSKVSKIESKIKELDDSKKVKIPTIDKKNLRLKKIDINIEKTKKFNYEEVKDSLANEQVYINEIKEMEEKINVLPKTEVLQTQDEENEEQEQLIEKFEPDE